MFLDSVAVVVVADVTHTSQSSGGDRAGRRASAQVGGHDESNVDRLFVSNEIVRAKE